MTFAYYGGGDAVECLRLMHEKRQKLTKNALKKLECIIYPEFYKKVALPMQDQRTTVQSLQKKIDTIVIRSVGHHAPGSSTQQGIRARGQRCVSLTRLGLCLHTAVYLLLLFLGQRHAHPRRGCSFRQASPVGDSWYMGLLAANRRQRSWSMAGVEVNAACSAVAPAGKR